MEIRNATALITGANRGIGRALVAALLQTGAKTIYAASREPRNLEAHATRAMAYAQLPQHNPAIPASTKAIHLNPKDPTLGYNRRNAHHSNGEHYQAVADYT